MKDTYYTIDLCAGIGGIRRGFELTGHFENIISAEIDEKAAMVYERLFSDDPRNDVMSKDFLDKLNSIGSYDVLLAGFPCQAFSGVGKRAGFDDDRGAVFFGIEEIIKQTRPKALFLENVQNLLSHDHGRTIKKIIEILENDLDYKIIGVSRNIEDGRLVYSQKTLVRNSKNFGVPQNRPRTYLIGFDRSFFMDKLDEIPTELPRGNGKKIFDGLDAILEKEVLDKYYLSSGYLDTLKRHRERQHSKGFGFGYCVVNSGRHHTANTIMATGGSGKERNLISQYKEGVSGKMVKGKKTPLNSENIRVMTPVEWGRLQGFIGYAFMNNGIDCFSFPDGFSDAMKYKVFGNSVTIPAVETFAEFILHCFQLMDY